MYVWGCVCVFEDPHVNQSLISCVNGFPVTLKMRSDSVFFLIYMFLNEYDFVVVSTRASVLMKIPIVRHSSCMLTAGLVVAVGNAVLGRILKMPRVRWEAVPSSLRKRVDQEWVKGSRCTEPPLPARLQAPSIICLSSTRDLGPTPSVEDVTSLSPPLSQLQHHFSP